MEFALLACENPGHKAARVVPALERVNPSWGEIVTAISFIPSISEAWLCKNLSCNESIGAPPKFRKIW